MLINSGYSGYTNLSFPPRGTSGASGYSGYNPFSGYSGHYNPYSGYSGSSGTSGFNDVFQQATIEITKLQEQFLGRRLTTPMPVERKVSNAMNLMDWKTKINDNNWVDTLPSDLKPKVLALRGGCSCDRARRIAALIPEMTKYIV